MAADPWVTLMLGFGSLKSCCSVRNLGGAPGGPGDRRRGRGPVRQARPDLPLERDHVRGAAAGLGGGVAAGVFGAAEAVPWRRADKLPKEMTTPAEYERQAAKFRTGLSEICLTSGTGPGCLRSRQAGDTTKDQGAGGSGRVRSPGCSSSARAARRHLAAVAHHRRAAGHGRVRMAAGRPAAGDRPNVGIALAGVALPALAAFLYAGWSNPAKRRTIGILWAAARPGPGPTRAARHATPNGPCPTCSADVVAARQRRPGHAGRAQPGQRTRGRGAGPDRVPSRGRHHPALITFGSPVCKLYGWAFPAFFDGALLVLLAPGQAARG